MAVPTFSEQPGSQQPALKAITMEPFFRNTGEGCGGSTGTGARAHTIANLSSHSATQPLQ
jgi:hypothetical protein